MPLKNQDFFIWTFLCSTLWWWLYFASDFPDRFHRPQQSFCSYFWVARIFEADSRGCLCEDKLFFHFQRRWSLEILLDRQIFQFPWKFVWFLGYSAQIGQILLHKKILSRYRFHSNMQGYLSLLLSVLMLENFWVLHWFLHPRCPSIYLLSLHEIWDNWS